MENLECPECGKKTMFENRAGGLTCANKECERVLFPCSAEEARKMLCIIRGGNEIIKLQEKTIDLMNQKMALIEAKIKG